MQKYECSVCGYIYDPAVGDPDADIPPGTAFEDLPETLTREPATALVDEQGIAPLSAEERRPARREVRQERGLGLCVSPTR
mgnify:CR=1 FL=1